MPCVIKFSVLLKKFVQSITFWLLADRRERFNMNFCYNCRLKERWRLHHATQRSSCKENTGHHWGKHSRCRLIWFPFCLCRYTILSIWSCYKSVFGLMMSFIYLAMFTVQLNALLYPGSYLLSGWEKTRIFELVSIRFVLVSGWDFSHAEISGRLLPRSDGQ